MASSWGFQDLNRSLFRLVGPLEMKCRFCWRLYSPKFAVPSRCWHHVLRFQDVHRWNTSSCHSGTLPSYHQWRSNIIHVSPWMNSVQGKFFSREEGGICFRRLAISQPVSVGIWGGPLRQYSDQSEPEWEDVLYLTENYRVIRSDKGVRDFRPGVDNYVYAGKKRTDVSDTEGISQICNIIRRWGWGPNAIRELDSLSFNPNAFHVTEVMKSFRELNTIMGLFSWIRQKRWYTPSTVIFTTLIDRFGCAGDFEKVTWLLHTMQQERCDRVAATYNVLIKCYAKALKLDEAHAYFVEMRNMGFQTDIFHINILIDSFWKAGLHQKALEIFEQIEPAGCVPDERTFKLMAPSLAKAGNLDQACRLYYQMTAKGYYPDLSSYCSLIHALAKAGRFDSMMQIYGNMRASGIPPNPPIFAIIIESFARAGKIEKAMTVFMDSRNAGYKPFTSTYSTLIEAHSNAMQLDAAVQLYNNMLESGCSPTIGLVSDLISSLLNAKQLAKAGKLFNGMLAARVLPTPVICSALVDVHVQAGDFEAAVMLYKNIEHTYELLLTQAKENSLSDRILRTTQEMTEFKYSVNQTGSSYLTKLLQEGEVEVAGKWFQLMIEDGLQPNSKISAHLMEASLKYGFYDLSKKSLDHFLKLGSSPNLRMYCAILSCFSRCSNTRQDGILASIMKQERVLMSMLSSTGHQAHKFLCSLWSGPEQRQEAPLDLVRSFFQRLEIEADVQLARWFTAVLLNYLVLVGQIKRARCVWKVAYERKIFPGRILFDRDVVWSLDVRTLSIGAALTAVVHTLHRFRKRMMDYDTVPRRIKIVTGFNLREPVIDMLKPLGAPFETSGGCLRCRGQIVADWFNQPFVEKFLENELPSSDEIRLQRLKLTFPQPAQEPYMLIMNAGMAK